MIVSFNYRDKVKAAYEAGATAAALHAKWPEQFKKPDVEEYLKSREHPPVMRG